MTTQTFDTAFADLLRAFRTHHELRATGADIPELARSSHDLFNARLAMRSAVR